MAEQTPTPVGIISGTGPAGAALATRLAASGVAVLIGSRQATRSAEVAAAICDELPEDARQLVASGTNAVAASCTIAVLATSADAAVRTGCELADELDGAILVSMAANLTRGTRGMRPVHHEAGSVAEALADALPATRVTASLHHIAAKELGDLSEPLTAGFLVCGDDEDAVEAVIALLDPMTSGDVLDVGGLHNAVGLEAMTPVLISINLKYGGHAGIAIERS